MMENDAQDKSLGIHVIGRYQVESLVVKALPKRIKKNHKFSPTDSIRCLYQSKEGFVLEFKRFLRFIPRAHFEASVVIVSKIFFDHKSDLTAMQTDAEIAKWISDNQVRILDTFGVPASASVILSSCLSQAGFGPYATPPHVMLQA